MDAEALGRFIDHGVSWRGDHPRIRQDARYVAPTPLHDLAPAASPFDEDAEPTLQHHVEPIHWARMRRDDLADSEVVHPPVGRQPFKLRERRAAHRAVI